MSRFAILGWALAALLASAVGTGCGPIEEEAQQEPGVEAPVELAVQESALVADPFADPLYRETTSGVVNSWVETRACNERAPKLTGTYNYFSECNFNCSNPSGAYPYCAWSQEAGGYQCYKDEGRCLNETRCKHFDGQCTGSKWPWYPAPSPRTVTVRHSTTGYPTPVNSYGSASATTWNAYPWVVVCADYNMRSTAPDAVTYLTGWKTESGTAYCVW